MKIKQLAKGRTGVAESTVSSAVCRSELTNSVQSESSACRSVHRSRLATHMCISTNAKSIQVKSEVPSAKWARSAKRAKWHGTSEVQVNTPCLAHKSQKKCVVRRRIYTDKHLDGEDRGTARDQGTKAPPRL
eukprot:scaffold6217_cov125-Isochrysis_galbana.AAC.4